MDLVEPVLAWYDANARDLPWRRSDATAWSVLVSEIMLQQTPVSRVLPVHREWLDRWPTPTDLAVEAPGEAVRAWGRLGYPRRALRLHEAATRITSDDGGEVPADLAALRALPGIGDYTAAAVAVFAFGQRHAVLDTNVRRVHARVLDGVETQTPTPSRAERDRAHALLPDDAPTAATWSVAVMELGALVCSARSPDCGACPVADRCAWQLAGRPTYDGPRRAPQPWAGTDRQCRGRLLAAVRDAPGSVPRSRLDQVWHDPAQRERALGTLVADGLLVPLDGDRYALP